ncbi:hypothetical protein HYV49_03140 [Candidatus Pacearchaeota archaeon]|nr:hypothetical protein [Candidatus Pacearchaeota archaeon]
MQWARQSGSFRVYFSVENGTGALATNINSGSFTASVVDPTDTFLTRSVVTETIKPGLYRFDVTSSFLVNYGTGSYGVVIEVSSSSPSVIASSGDILRIFKSDLDNLTATATVDNAAIADAVWDEAVTGHSGSNTFGEKVAKKLLTFSKWIGLR